MEKKEYKLSIDAIRHLYEIKIEDKNLISIESITIKSNFIFQIEKVKKIKESVYSSTLFDTQFKSDNFLLIFAKNEEIPKRGDILNIKEIKKYYNKEKKTYVFECENINFIKKESNFVVDISKIVYYDNKIINKEKNVANKNKIINDKNNQKLEDNEIEDEEDEEESEEEDDEEEDEDKKINEINNNGNNNENNINNKKYNNKNNINYEEEKSSDKNIINSKKNQNKIIENNSFRNKNKKFLFVSKLDFSSQNFNIYIKCLKKFEIKEFRFKKNKQYQNYIFSDINDEKIEAVAFDEMSDKLNKILEINKIYQINNCYLIPNNKYYSKTDCPFKLYFQNTTEIYNVENENIKKNFKKDKEIISQNKNKKNFIPISDISNNNKYDIINVLGFVLKDNGTSSFYDKYNNEYFARSYWIGDDSNYKINIIFWHPNDLKKVFEEGELLYIQNIKVGEFRKIKTLSSTKEKMIKNGFNSQTDKKLKKYYSEHKNIDDYLVVKSNKYNNYSNKNTSQLLFIKEILKIFENQNNKNKELRFKISAYVKFINHSPKNYYYGCKNCKKKMQKDICQYCGNNKKVIIIHFSVNVIDSTGTLWLLFFGDIAEGFLGIKGAEYKNIIEKGISFQNKELQMLNQKVKDKQFLFFGKSKYYSYHKYEGYRFNVRFFTKKSKGDYHIAAYYLKNLLK